MRIEEIEIIALDCAATAAVKVTMSVVEVESPQLTLAMPETAEQIGEIKDIEAGIEKKN